ncbi:MULTISPECIES: hypothetical protein [Methylosinus]|uniref:Helix-turn-helix domain-containing protein n=1 Tax=Methylosinus trichosporium (strain ATCC 35070 / NCIMB 11131 / UNIQEM 75 / OB3b) TaxID=595536 RepID=A0A2D2CYW8_METT3|nr:MULTISPECIES: hypothetical protein [Methylosinus]ATQ67926.1 hypothetical protein CQW49_08520 [Methylosinus trichosporium OB3b]OBS53792.1 hypothetical protein A8B73_04680 [Methylosinus sp. 3S-1]
MKNRTFTIAQWTGAAALDVNLSPLALRFACLYGSWAAEKPGEAIGINYAFAAQKFRAPESAIFRALSELVARGYLVATIDDGRPRYRMADPDVPGGPIPWEESPEDAKRHRKRRRALKKQILEALPDATQQELFAFGADLVLQRKASLFDLAALVETPASAIISDFQRLADRQVTANDFFSDDEPF